MNVDDTILVTGSRGVLGQAIIKSLDENGFKHVISPDSKTLNLLDYGEVDRFIEKFKPKYVFHLASLVFGLKGNLNNQIKSLSNNTIINNNLLLSCCNHANCVRKIFFAGTVAAYPFPFPSLPLKEEFYTEGTPHWGEYGYAMSKRHALSYLNIMKENHNIDFCYGIFTNLYGPGDKFDIENGHVIPSLIEKSFLAKNSDKKDLVIWGKKSTTRDFMFSFDAANAALLAMKKYSGLINISSGKETTIESVCNAINNWHGQRLNLIWDVNAPIGIPKRSVSDCILKSLDFKCKFDIDAGISHVMNWYADNLNNIRK